MAALLGVGIAGALGLAGRADAGIITISNTSSVTGIGKSTLTAKNISGATEGYGYADGSFASSPYTNALEIYTMVDGHKLSTDARPVDTTGWDFDLAVKGSVSGIDNYLRYKITDTTDLIGKTVTMYDKATPSTVYTLLMDGAYHNINLPNLTHGAGEYAHWRMEITPEPATLALLGLGAATLVAGGRRKRRRAE